MNARFIMTLLIPSLLLLGNTVLAHAEEKGWSGSVGLLLGGVSGEGQLDAYGGKKRIESLNAKPARYNYDFLFPIFQTGYTFQNNISIYMDGDLLGGGGVGISHTLDDKTSLSVYLPLFLGTSSEVWQDPYMTGEDRKTTDAKLDAAIGFSIDNIWGSFASIDYLYQDLSVKNDRAGESLNTRLTSAEIKQLRRGNKSHNITVSLPPLTLGDGFYLIAGASHIRTSAEGDANSFAAHSVDLTLAYEKGRFEFFGNISSGKSNYRAVNPVFNIKRKGDLSTIAVGITYWKPFGWTNSSLELMVASEHNNSNINFYDARNDLLTTSFSYNF